METPVSLGAVLLGVAPVGRAHPARALRGEGGELLAVLARLARLPLADPADADLALGALLVVLAPRPRRPRQLLRQRRLLPRAHVLLADPLLRELVRGPDRAARVRGLARDRETLAGEADRAVDAVGVVLASDVLGRRGAVRGGRRG